MRLLMTALMTRIVKDEKGQDLVEYGLLVTLIALVAIAGINLLAPAVNQAFSNAATQLGS
jgi:pilus assembly protein Flp/PilA